MTNQEAFTKMVLHLRKQGERSSSEFNLCRYRNQEGLSCAVGCLIPDEDYKLSFEGQDASYVREKLPVLQELDEILLLNMQNVHDRAHPEAWESEFEQVAKVHGLEVPPC